MRYSFLVDRPIPVYAIVSNYDLALKLTNGPFSLLIVFKKVFLRPSSCTPLVLFIVVGVFSKLIYASLFTQTTTHHCLDIALMWVRLVAVVLAQVISWGSSVAIWNIMFSIKVP